MLWTTTHRPLERGRAGSCEPRKRSRLGSLPYQRATSRRIPHPAYLSGAPRGAQKPSSGLSEKRAGGEDALDARAGP
jgi:hypothetical protein